LYSFGYTNPKGERLFMQFLVSYIKFDNKLNPNKLHLLDQKLIDLLDEINLKKYENFPYIQYKIIDEKLWTVSYKNIGLKFIDKIINSDISNISIEEINCNLVINRVSCKKLDLDFYKNKSFVYEIKNYIPFHSISYLTFTNLEKDKKKDYLTKFIKRHLHHFFRFIGFDRETINNHSWMDLIDYQEKKTRILYGAMVKSFDVIIKTNIFLPEYIGIGRFSKYSGGMIKLKEVINN